MSKPDYFADVPISVPVVIPKKEDYRMNGFAWSHDMGLLIAMHDEVDQRVDYLRRLRQPNTNENNRER